MFQLTWRAFIDSLQLIFLWLSLISNLHITPLQLVCWYVVWMTSGYTKLSGYVDNKAGVFIFTYLNIVQLCIYIYCGQDSYANPTVKPWSLVI